MVIYCWTIHGYDGMTQVFIVATSVEEARELARAYNLSPQMLEYLVRVDPDPLTTPKVLAVVDTGYGY